MMKSELMNISFNNLKAGNNDVSAHDFVRYAIRNAEYNSVNAKISADKKAIEEEHAGVDAMTCGDDILKMHFGESTVGKDAMEKFKSNRKECSDIKAELDTIAKNGVDASSFAGLNNVDKIFITLCAHANYTRVNLDAKMLDGVDCVFESIVTEYYTKNKVKNVKDRLRTIFYETVGKSGNLFYGVKLKKSDFSDEDVKNFLAIFGGKEKRVKNADGTYSLRWVYDANAIVAITKLFAVVLDNHKNYEVVKDAPEAPETEKVEAEKSAPAADAKTEVASEAVAA